MHTSLSVDSFASSLLRLLLHVFQVVLLAVAMDGDAMDGGAAFPFNCETFSSSFRVFPPLLPELLNNSGPAPHVPVRDGREGEDIEGASAVYELKEEPYELSEEAIAMFARSELRRRGM